MPEGLKTPPAVEPARLPVTTLCVRVTVLGGSDSSVSFAMPPPLRPAAFLIAITRMSLASAPNSFAMPPPSLPELLSETMVPFSVSEP